MMGVSNSEILLSEKDLKTLEVSLLVRPALRFLDHELSNVVATSQESCFHKQLPEDDQEKREEKDQQKNDLYEKKQLEDGAQDHKNEFSSLDSSAETSKLSLGEMNVREYDDDDVICRTPRSPNRRIPENPRCCPPAPRKPKPEPSKRFNVPSCRRSALFLDFAKEVESLFPPSLLSDLGNKIKKARH